MSDTSLSNELGAMRVISLAMNGLTVDSQRRVLDWVTDIYPRDAVIKSVAMRKSFIEAGERAMVALREAGREQPATPTT